MKKQPSNYRLVMWDWNEEVPLEELRDDVNALLRSHRSTRATAGMAPQIYFNPVATESDMYAMIITTERISPSMAARLFKRVAS